MFKNVKTVSAALLGSAALFALPVSVIGQGKPLALKPIEKSLEFRDTMSPEQIQRFAQRIDGWDRTWKE